MPIQFLDGVVKLHARSNRGGRLCVVRSVRRRHGSSIHLFGSFKKGPSMDANDGMSYPIVSPLNTTSSYWNRLLGSGTLSCFAIAKTSHPDRLL